MKNYLKLATVAVALLMVTAIVVTFEACRKDKISSNIEGKINEGIVYQQNIADRETYIIDFKKKYLSGSKSDEVMTAENANAFLFDLLNFDFCNINGDGPDKMYEISTYTLNVSNGTVNVNEFANLYSEISSHVYNYYHKQNVDNANYYCIMPEIAEFDANATKTMVTVKTTLTSGMPYKNMNFDSTLCDYFTEYEYQWQDAADTLEKYFNIEFPRCSLGSDDRCFFSCRKGREFYYLDYPFPGTFRYRLYYCGICDYSHATIDNEKMCELLNNYIDLACEYSYGACVMNCNITPEIGNRGTEAPVPIHHVLYVNYADIVCTNNEPQL
ncbi:MAG: hypothetical protein KBT67_10510 [bacterium]|nr:hypothetical protein [Candidatus Limimorpha caballi]